MPFCGTLTTLLAFGCAAGLGLRAPVSVLGGFGLPGAFGLQGGDSFFVVDSCFLRFSALFESFGSVLESFGLSTFRVGTTVLSGIRVLPFCRFLLNSPQFLRSETSQQPESNHESCFFLSDGEFR